MDWTGCELVEVVAGKLSGAPVIRGTRIPPEALTENFEAGSSEEELLEDYPSLTPEIITEILAYAERHLLSAAS